MNWGFIGCGNLAQAIISGAIQKGSIQPENVFASDPLKEKLQAFSARSGIKISQNNSDLIRDCDVIVLATKPQDLKTVLEEINSKISKRHTVISLAAGVDSKTLLKYLPNAGHIFRVMANTAAMVQMGVFGIFGAKTNPEMKNQVENFFGALGTVAALRSDNEVNAITSASASGTGFVLMYMEEFERWLKSKKIPPQSARDIALKTFEGAARLGQVRQDQTLVQLREAVTSKKGTTFAGLSAMKKSGVHKGISKGLNAAFKRALELSKLLR